MADVNIEIELEGKKAVISLKKIEDSLKDVTSQTKKLSSAEKGITSQRKQALEQSKKLQRATKDAAEASKKAQDAQAKRLKNIKIAAVGTLAAVAALGKGFSFAVDSAIALEDLETQFIAFTGSAASAADQVERIAEFSASTPFQLEDLANANRTLLAFGSSTKESLVQLRQLGEVAAATGNSVGDLSVIFGQIQAAGKLSGERFNQLVERGVNIGPVLAKSLGVAESALVEMRKQGKITSDDVAEAFRIMTTEGGQFAGSMERQSKTLSGSLSTLGDNITLLAGNIGSSLTPSLVAAANATTELIKSVNEGFEDDKIDTTAGRLEFLKGQITRADQQAFELNSQLERMGDVGENAARRANFNLITRQLEKVEQASALATEEFQKLSAAQNRAARTEQFQADETKKGEDAQKKKDEAKQAADEAAKEQLAAKEKLEADLLAIEQRQTANRRALAQTQSEERILFLQEEFDKLSEKQQELEIQKLENAGEFDAAVEAQALQHEENLNNIKEEGARERALTLQKANQDEVNLAKIQADEEIKFAQKTNFEKARALKDGLNNVVALQKTGSKTAFEIGKAAAVAQAAIAIPESALQAYKSGVGIGGPPLGTAFAAAATVAQVSRLQQIQQAKFTGYNEGGLVTGGIPGQDSVPAMLTPGELVVPEKNFDDLGIGGDKQVVEEIRAMNKNIEDQNQILFNISASTSDTAIGTSQVAAGVLNINLPGANNPGSGGDYTDKNIEWYVEGMRYYNEYKAQEEANELATSQIDPGTGQANVIV